MTYTKYAVLCALFAPANAEIKITVDDAKIQRVGMDFIGWIGG